MKFLQIFKVNASNPLIRRGEYKHMKKLPMRFPLFRIIEHMANLESDEDKVELLKNIRRSEFMLLQQLFEWAYGDYKFSKVAEHIVLDEWVPYKGNQNFAISDIYEEIKRLAAFTDDDFDEDRIGFIANRILGGFEELPVKDAEILQAIIENKFMSDVITPKIAEMIGVKITIPEK